MGDTSEHADALDSAGTVPAEDMLRSYSRRDLRWSDLPSAVRILFLLAKLVLLQKRVSVPRLVASFDPAPRPGASEGIDMSRVTWLTRGLLRRLFSGRYCMKRSLVLFYHLRRAGRDAKIYFGVAKEDGKLEGHAWVTVDGHAYAEEGSVDQYTITYSYPG